MAATILASITRVLQTIPDCQREVERVMSDSQVTASNPHRRLLESVRSDLEHVDDEKKNRMIYYIDKYVKDHSNASENEELIAVLSRILEVLNRYGLDQKILTTPIKETPSLSHARVQSGAPRRLFDVDDVE